MYFIEYGEKQQGVIDMKNLMFFLIFLLIFINPANAWYDLDYEGRAEFNISNTCWYCVINITTIYNVSDRWTDNNDTLLNFWSEPSNLNVWVNLTNNTILYKYFDNENSHLTLSNGSNTFIQFKGESSVDFQMSNIKKFPYIYDGLARRTSNGAVDQIAFGVSNIQNSESITANTTIIDRYYAISSDGIAPNVATILNPKWTQNIWYRIQIIHNGTAIIFYPYGDLATTITHFTDIPLVYMGLNSYRQTGTGEQLFSFIRNYPTNTTYSYNTTSYVLSNKASIYVYNKNVFYNIIDGFVNYKIILLDNIKDFYVNGSVYIWSYKNFYVINKTHGNIEYKFNINNVSKMIEINNSYYLINNDYVYGRNKNNNELIYKIKISSEDIKGE